MSVVTLSAKMYELAFRRFASTSLPKTSFPFDKFQNLYQYTTYIEVESEYSTPEKPIRSYVPLQFIREETATLTAGDGPSIIIWCKALDNDTRQIQFTKAYFMILVKRRLVHTDKNIVREVKIEW